MQDGCQFCQTKEQDFLGVSQWPDGDIPWTITALIPGVTLEQMKEDIAWGYALWARNFGIKPRYVSDAREARVLIGTRRIDGPSGVLAEAELPSGSRQVRMWFDVGDSWTSQFDDGTRRIITKLVGVHEGGHTLGFGHAPSGSPNILAPIYNSKQRTAGPWDIAQGRSRYGNPVISEPEPTPTPSPTPGGLFVDEAAVKAAIQKALNIAGWVAKQTTPTWDDAAVNFLSQDFVINLRVMLFMKFGNNIGTATPKAIEEAVLSHLAGL